MVSIVSGKVAEAEAAQATGQRKRELQDEAISWYKEAIQDLSSLDAKEALSEAYGRLAQLLESSGRQDEAVAYWRSAYSLYSTS